MIPGANPPRTAGRCDVEQLPPGGFYAVPLDRDVDDPGRQERHATCFEAPMLRSGPSVCVWKDRGSQRL